jgi:hypothetical protein
VAFALAKTRLAANFDTVLSGTTIVADHLARTGSGDTVDTRR